MHAGSLSFLALLAASSSSSSSLSSALFLRFFGVVDPPLLTEPDPAPLPACFKIFSHSLSFTTLTPQLRALVTLDPGDAPHTR